MFRTIAAFLILVAEAGGPCFAQVPGEKVLNDQVCAQLAQQNDDGTTSRPIDHWAFPVSGTRTAKYREIASLLDGMGFAVEPAAGNGGIKFSKPAVLADDGFDELTEWLRKTLAEKGWNYDGWETIVVRKGD